MPAEERRLVAEEGSYSLKTWLLKTEDGGGWVSSSTGPQSPGGQSGELQYRAQLTASCLTSNQLDGRAWLVGYLWILLIQEPPEPAVLYSFPGRGPKTGSRRRIVTKEDLAAEDLGGQASS